MSGVDKVVDEFALDGGDVGTVVLFDHEYNESDEWILLLRLLYECRMRDFAQFK